MRLERLFSTLVAVAQSKLPCFDQSTGTAHWCAPDFGNAAFQTPVEVSNTCGIDRPEKFFRQTRPTSRSSGTPRLICDNSQPNLQHPPAFLTDHEDKDTWWQSQSMYDSRKYGNGIQYPNNVTLTLDLKKNYEIISIRLKFHSPRPESMKIEKFYDGRWSTYQYFSASCFSTYNKTEDSYIIPGNEKMALCDSQYSKISPLSGGEIIFATLGNRPSNEHFENSKVLQEFVTASKLRVVLNRMNTFGDELFQDQRVLRSYYYAISDFVVGGKCRCNGHADNCDKTSSITGDPVCDCSHNTMGDDCEVCLPLFNNKPWRRATTKDAAVCEECDCNGLADSCEYDEQLGFGRCINCLENTAGPRCEECAANHFRDPETGKCVPCKCHVEGSKSAQCDANGNCQCQMGVIGVKCDRCQDNHWGLSRSGCQPCHCNIAGSANDMPSCDAFSGQCRCKANVTGKQCEQCRNGFMGVENSNGQAQQPDPENEFGCTPCFCFNHSNQCSASKDFVKTTVSADFSEPKDSKGWVDKFGNPVAHHDIMGNIASDNGFSTSADFTGSQRKSYNQKITFDLALDNELDSINSGRFIIQGQNEMRESVRLSANIELEQTADSTEYSIRLHENYVKPQYGDISAKQFITILDNLESMTIDVPPASLDNVKLETAELRYPNERNSDDVMANWIEECQEHRYEGRSLDTCADGYTRAHKNKNLVSDAFDDCVQCDCNKHSQFPCDPESGVCDCSHDTAGDHCETCAEGFYGDARIGNKTDCAACPCPGGTACHLIDIVEGAGGPMGVSDGIPVLCTNCPHGSTGARCEECKENFFGDPLGRYGSPRPCQECNCSGNIDLLMTGNCNRTTGECLKCLYNTEGGHCQLCKAGFYGDPRAPLSSQEWKGCRDCNCDPSGTVDGGFCDSTSGTCPCLNGITGMQCTECEPQHYGFGLFGNEGCRPCNCDPVGAVSGECDVDHMGEYVCECKPGVTGTKCDQCMAGFYGMDRDGCKSCDCDMQGSTDEQCDLEGRCRCKEGVQGDKCDQCALNHYDISAGCKKCDACYNLVEHTYNGHKNELSRLRRMANDLTDMPSKLNSDDEFNTALDKLSEKSRNLEEDSQNILRDYEVMVQELSSAANNAQDIMEKLDEFANELQSCEKDVSDAKVKQKATDGTIHTLKHQIVDIEQILAETEESIADAERMAEKQKARHEELLALAEQSAEFMEQIQKRSEEVQNKAAEAQETAIRARQEILNSMETLKTLKQKLENIASNDVKVAIRRIMEAKSRAKEAKEQAEEARNRALDLYGKVMKITIPNLSPASLGLREDNQEQNIEAIAQSINNEADRLLHELETLQNKFNNKKQTMEESQSMAEKKYKKGKEYLDQADKLMAMVHSAKMDGQVADQKIKDLMSKAEKLYEQLSIFHSQFDSRGDSKDYGEATVPDIQKQLKNAEQKYGQLEDHVQQLETEADRVYDDAGAVANDAAGQLADAKSSMEQAQALENDVQEALNELKNKNDMTSNIEETLGDKTDQINEQKAESTKALAHAEEAKVKAEKSRDNLDRLLKRIAQLQDEKLMAVLEQTEGIAEEFHNCDQGGRICLENVQSKLQEYRDQFETIKEEQNKKIESLHDELNKDSAKLEDMKNKKVALTSEVENLEKIRSVLPEWCQGDSNEGD